MLFTNELDSLAERVSAAQKRTSLYRVRAMETSARLRELRERAAGLSRELGRLGVRSNYAVKSARLARYAKDSSRMRSCYDRSELLSEIIDGVSDALIAVREEILAAEESLLTLRSHVDAAGTLAAQAERRLADARRDRDRYIAEIACVPAEQLNSGSYVIKVSSRWEGQIDVYYNVVGRRPLGPGHAHVAVDFDGNVLHHRPPGFKRPSRAVPKPNPGLYGARAGLLPAAA